MVKQGCTIDLSRSRCGNFCLSKPLYIYIYIYFKLFGPNPVTIITEMYINKKREKAK